MNMGIFENKMIPKYRLIHKILSITLTFLTVCVLQTETGFVSFCHFGTVGVEQIIVGENIHAVVVTVKYRDDVIMNNKK